MGLSIASLVLGIVALFSGPVTGIPAVITGIIALARKRPGRGLAIGGLVTGAFGTLIITVFWVAMLIFVLSASDSDKEEKVWRNMGFVHTAMENWYISHDATYPGPDVSWDPASTEPGMVHCFPDGDPDPLDGPPVPGDFPVNPYSDEYYELGRDLFFFPDWLEPGQHDITEDSDPQCPFTDLAAPGGEAGTIVILGWSRETEDGPQLERYAVVGYDDDTDEPMHETEWEDGTPVHVYRVRYN